MTQLKQPTNNLRMI